MNLFDQISNDIKSAMLAKDKVKLGALRNLKKYFLEAKTAPGANDVLTDEAALKIIRKLVKQGKDAAQIYATQNRPDLAEEEQAQVRALEAYLPPPISPEELDSELKKIIDEIGANGLKDLNKVMEAAVRALSGRAEGRTVSEAAKRLLS